MSTEIVQWSVSDLEMMAANVAKSKLFGMDQAQAFTLMCVAQAKGLHPIEAMQRYDIVLGKPAMKAMAMLADFQAIGGNVAWVTKSDDRQRCEAIFTHPRFCPGGQRVTFTVQDAQTAGLANKDNWKHYPASMMRARVISIGIGMLCPGIRLGFYTPEEVGDFVNPIPVLGRVLKDPVTGREMLLPDPLATSEPGMAVEPEPEPPPREPGSDDVRPKKEPVTRVKIKDGPWLEQAAAKKDLATWFLEYGANRGFPKFLSLWSPIMVGEAIKARKEIAS